MRIVAVSGDSIHTCIDSECIPYIRGKKARMERKYLVVVIWCCKSLPI